MPLIIPANTLSGGYEVANSCRFDGDGDSLSREIDGVNTTKLTISLWFKVCQIDGTYGNILFSSENNGSDYLFIAQNTAGNLDIKITGTANRRITNATYRDPTAWYHLCVIFDSTQGSATDRIKVYVNGTQVTSFSTENNGMAEDSNLSPVDETVDYAIGTYHGQHANWSIDGYMAEVVAIYGSALAPTSFGEFDEDSPTIWKPIDVSELTFSGNSFYLDFEDSADLGADVSGNSDDFTVNNLTSVDQTTDTPTNNFATMNVLAPANIDSASEGNLKIVQSSSGGSAISTMGFGSGKWYWEIEIDSQVTYTQLAGVIKESQMEAALLTSFNVGANSGGWSYFLQSNTDNGKAFHNNSASSVYTTVSDGDILSIAVDADNGKIYFGVNGTWVNSGDPAAGSNEVYSGLPTDEIIFPAITNYLGTGSGTPTMLMNFGNPPFSISSGNADADGYGNFEYAVPSGYYALCTKNLAEYG